MPKTASSLPVLMHHYICNYTNSIAVSPQRFEEQCAGMAEKGWRGISLPEAEAYFLSREPLPQKSAFITFDDGYLDNYFYAAPLLKKYGHHGVMFAVTDRLEPHQSLRASFEDLLAGKVPATPEVHNLIRNNAVGLEERYDVFCSRAEARFMDHEGTMAVAGHARSHVGVFTGPQYESVCRPKNIGRTFYKTTYGTIWGLPKFSVKPGLAHRAFLPDEDMIVAIKQLVPQDLAGAAEFFRSTSGVQDLERLLRNHTDRMGRFETDAEQHERMFTEIATGKRELEAILGHTVQTLCWPWGAYSDPAVNIARSAGYRVFITTRPGVNPPGCPENVHRFKVRSKSACWLLNRLTLYAHPLMGRVYAAIR